MRISDWSSDVCSSDLKIGGAHAADEGRRAIARGRIELQPGYGRDKFARLAETPSTELIGGKRNDCDGNLLPWLVATLRGEHDVADLASLRSGSYCCGPDRRLRCGCPLSGIGSTWWQGRM